MIPTQRAGLTAAVVFLLALGTTSFAPPEFSAAYGQRPGGFRPPPTPPVRPPTLPPAGGRGGMTPGTFAGGRGGSTPGTFSGSRPGTFTGGSSGGSRTGVTPGTFSGGAARTPAEITTGLRKAAETNPRSVFTEMRVGEGRTLPEATRVTISRETAQRLAARVESARDAVSALNEVRAVRAETAGLSESVRRPIERVQEAARRRVLNDALGQLRAEAEAGRWASAAEKAKGWEGRLKSVAPGGEGKEITAHHLEVEAACRSAADLGARLGALERFTAAVEGKPAARDLAAIDTARLPEPLRRTQEGLRGVAELREAAGQKWAKAPDVDALKGSLSRLEGIGGEVDAALVKRLATDLAVKALIEGHTPEFFKLLPGDVPPEHAAQALRDLKALALGEGKVEGWAAKSAGEPGKGPGGPRPPPGLEPLIPEGKREGWRPPASEKGTAGLPPLGKAEAAGEKAREGAKSAAKAERAKLDGEAAKARQVLADTQARVMAPELAERRRFASVEYRLDRRLTPLERTKVRDWLDDGRSPDDFVGELRRDAGDDDERFVAEVARVLGRPLDDAERQQARRLRREGRRAVEVAELLKP